MGEVFRSVVQNSFFSLERWHLSEKADILLSVFNELLSQKLADFWGDRWLVYGTRTIELNQGGPDLVPQLLVKTSQEYDGALFGPADKYSRRDLKV